jgi:UrcA family protein
MNISLSMLALAFALAASGAKSADVGSAVSSNGPRMVVQFGDLDISTERDAKVLLMRIERGATKACGGHRTFNSFTGAVDGSFDECRNEVIRKAIAQIDAPLVTRLYFASCERWFRRCA